VESATVAEPIGSAVGRRTARTAGLVAGGAIGVALALGIAGVASGALRLADVHAAYRALVPPPARRVLYALLYNELWLLAPALLILERLFPANGRQRLLSIGLAQDWLWHLSFRILTVLVLLGAYGRFLRDLYDQYLSSLTLDIVASLPLLVRIVLSVLAIDFVWWLRHYIRHRVSVLWYFHAVHHSQRELNFLTNLRIHFVESVFDATLMFLPMFMLQIDMPTDFYIAAAVRWNLFLQHANIRSNLGPLKHVLVTPQAHRIHHSIEPHHRDLNFGSLFTIWDRIFGTLHRDYEEYPDTGIADAGFPLEQDSPGLVGMLRTFVAQTAYPFGQALQHVRARFAGRLAS
jgi:sterol desaturase/sphingolipid hydroxylase (fatty acid hydroxylase superfamily)